MNIKEGGTQQMLTKNMADHNKMMSVWATAPWTLQQPTDVIIHWILWNFYTQMSKYCCYWHILGAWLWILYWTPARSWSGSRSMFPLRLQEEIQTFKWETETEKNHTFGSLIFPILLLSCQRGKGPTQQSAAPSPTSEARGPPLALA